jgi:hypothetical protein
VLVDGDGEGDVAVGVGLEDVGAGVLDGVGDGEAVPGEVGEGEGEVVGVDGLGLTGDGVTSMGSQSRTNPPFSLSVMLQLRPALAISCWMFEADVGVLISPKTRTDATANTAATCFPDTFCSGACLPLDMSILSFGTPVNSFTGDLMRNYTHSALWVVVAYPPALKVMSYLKTFRKYQANQPTKPTVATMSPQVHPDRKFAQLIDVHSFDAYSSGQEVHRRAATPDSIPSRIRESYPMS